MAPQTPEQEQYDLCMLKAAVRDAEDQLPDFHKVYCIPKDDDWELENLLGRFSRGSGAVVSFVPSRRGETPRPPFI